MPEAASVSVVIPCWRCADTIGRAVASVAAQTRPAFEVLLVDDASGDGTLNALRELAACYPLGWVKVIGLPENGGPGPARNAGWDAARGSYIALLDADDAWHPRKLELHMAWLAVHPEVALSGHRSVLFEEGHSPPSAKDVLKARRVTLSAMLVSNRFPTRSVIVKRELPFRFEGRAVTEDFLLWLQVVASGAPCYSLDAPLAISFRPDFSSGGYSGHLWTHERRELAAIRVLRSGGQLSAFSWFLASAWSLCKYARRAMLAALRRIARPIAGGPACAR